MLRQGSSEFRRDPLLDYAEIHNATSTEDAALLNDAVLRGVEFAAIRNELYDLTDTFKVLRSSRASSTS